MRAKVDMSAVEPISENQEALAVNESFISTDTVKLTFMVDNEEPIGYVRFDGFETIDDAREYIENLSESLPLLLFNSIRVH